MIVILLDASEWRLPSDFYSTLLPKLGAPAWHGRNLDALHDSLYGGINDLEPPFTVEVKGAGGLSSDLKAFFAQVAQVFEDARKNFGVDVHFVIS